MIFGRGPELKTRGAQALFYFVGKFYLLKKKKNLGLVRAGARAPLALYLGPSLVLELLHWQHYGKGDRYMDKF